MPQSDDDAVGVPLPVGASGFLERLSEREPPSVVTAIALVSGMWPSEPARFSAPHMLPPPPSGAHLDAASGILTMGEPPPGVEYRYTLDGTEPTLASPCYTSPVRLPRHVFSAVPREAALLLRVKAFPAPAAPSEELAMRLSLTRDSPGD